MRTKIKAIKNSEEQGLGYVGKALTIKGWVRTVRRQKTFTFIEINDGSTLSNFQVIADVTMKGYLATEGISTGAALAVTGVVVESPGRNQAVEMHAEHVELIGICDAEDYPLQKKRHSFEFLRTIAHLRPRTNTLGAVTRVRSCLSAATHRFFQEEGFCCVHTPIITASDCEGAGEMFQVTTMNLGEIPKQKDGTIDYSQDFFDKPAFLTVSGQLNAEIYASAVSDVYTFGPTFRAENSNTSRHLAEFWMVEPEMAFADLKDDMDCAEKYIKYLIKAVLDECREDMEFFNKLIEKGLVERLKGVLESDFKRLTYTDAVEILKQVNDRFEYPVKWGSDLQSEHERYLTEEHFKTPVILYNYPKDIKAFYMRINDDNKTVAAMDVLVPGVGEIIGGSQREERLDVLKERLKESDLSEKDYWWYLELRKYGSVPHAGFGLGFERLIQFMTGMENIRDVIPFPRFSGHAKF